MRWSVSLDFKDDNEIQLLILPQRLHENVLKSLHDNNSHQGLQCVMNLLWDKVYWPSMFADTDHWLVQCEQCLISNGDYTEPKTQQGSLVTHLPLELLCIDLTKANVVKGDKENILVLTDAFSKYSQAFVTNNQKSLTVAKILVEKWFSVFGILARIHSDQGRSFDNEIISYLCKMHGVRQSTTTPYNPYNNSQCEWFNCTLFRLMRTLNSEQKPNWPVYLTSLVYAYKATPHSSTGFQPYELMFGCKATTGLDWTIVTVWQMYFKIIIWDLNHNLQIFKCIKVVCYWISLILVSIVKLVLKPVWTVCIYTTY